MLPRPALTLLIAAFVPFAASAQTPPPQPDGDAVAPAHVAYVDGAVSLEREGRADNAPLNMPLLSGDRLRTADGRAEVLFADGSTLHLDTKTTIDVQSDELVRLIDGRLRLNILGPGDARGAALSVAYRIDSPAGSARITQPGEYRIALLHGTDETQLELAVVRGAGEVFTDEGTTPVRAGERAYASAGLAPSYAYAYNSATWDTFDRWSENRRDERLGVSAQYLPSDMRSYASVLDESGDWRYTQPYGYVWYPRVVADWRPYYYGRWASYPRYGWTWIGADRFAWPTHHYGRWGFSAGIWFWIPGSRWAPAYVSWGYAPGYVSWCPLGFDNRPVIAVNIFNVGPRYYSSRAWTSIAYSSFGRDYVHNRAVNWDRFDRARRPVFEERRAAPVTGRDVAVARNAAPISWAGSRTLPSPGTRAGAPDAGGRAVARDASAPIVRGSSGGRIQAPARETATPRYVNRGDEIVRSQTERPTAPRASTAPGIASPGGQARDGYAAPRRTAPDGAARPIDPRATSADPRVAQPRSYEPAATPSRATDPRVAQPRSYESGATPSRAYDPRAAQPRNYEPGAAPSRTADPRVAQPRSYESGAAPSRTADPRAAQPRSYEPRGEMPGAPGRVDPGRTDAPVYRPGYDARPRGPGGYDSRQNDQPARQAPASAPPGGREAVGRAEPVRPAPAPGGAGHIEGRQAPPERAAPRGGSGSRETAAPRDAGRPAPSGGAPTRRGGRGGV